MRPTTPSGVPPEQPSRRRGIAACLVAAVGLLLVAADGPTDTRRGPAVAAETVEAPQGGDIEEDSPGSVVGVLDWRQLLGRTWPTLLVFALASLVPAAVLMVTAYVRISIVLTLLRQALGSPQVPGTQVLAALSLLLTGLVMMPVAQQVYDRGIAPYAAGQLDAPKAWEAGTGPIKTFMIEQICRTRHQDYLWQLYDYSQPTGAPRTADPTDCEQFPLRVVAPAFLLSELTTALTIGFRIYLPFLVVDLVVSAVLAAMGLFMTPPSLVALPLKLILFVLADGWMLVAGMLLRSFGTPSG